MSWRDRAACRDADVELFFPDKGGSTRAAKAICAGCPVTDECLAWALANQERWGVYGGKSERERRRLRPARAPVARRRVA
jgi:WhiB family redox-sensing transcriptional regulator